MKYREGQYNKTFLLTFNNGSEVVAKLPNPNAGPKVLTVASEVATMDYVSSEFARQEYEMLTSQGTRSYWSTCSAGVKLELRPFEPCGK